MEKELSKVQEEKTKLADMIKDYEATIEHGEKAYTRQGQELNHVKDLLDAANATILKHVNVTGPGCNVM